MTTSMSPPDPPTRVKSESTSVATNHRWSAGQEGAGREVPRLWMSPSWGPWRPSGPRHQGGRGRACTLGWGYGPSGQSEHSRETTPGCLARGRRACQRRPRATVRGSSRPASSPGQPGGAGGERKGHAGRCGPPRGDGPGRTTRSRAAPSSPARPRAHCAAQPVRERRVGFEAQHPGSVLDWRHPAGISALSPRLAAAQAPDVPHARFGYV